MDKVLALFRRDFAAEAASEARRHPVSAGLLVLALGALTTLVAMALSAFFSGAPAKGLAWGLTGGLVGLASTAVGAFPALFIRHLPQKIEDSMLGAAAGMMLAASFFSLLSPALAAAEQVAPSSLAALALVLIGLFLGVALMLGLDRFTPHEHEKSGPCGPAHERCPRLLLFVFAIALHNLPEGMAIGVGFAEEDLEVGLPLAIAIALQNLPEGLAVALAMQGAGFAPVLAVLVAAGTGLMEPLGALLGLALSGGFPAAYPIGLALAAGAMIFVVSHEVIPQTHRNGHQTPATLGLMAGFALMVALDRLL